MHVEHLSSFHFRNLEDLDLAISSRTVLLQGANGQGKTNLLEAIYLCATGRSFRHAAPRELLRLGSDRGWVRATLSRHRVRHRVEMQLSAGRRSVRVDDRGLRHMSALLELVNVVAFFPDDLRIAKGGPDERRRFLDRAVANYRPDFVDASMAYVRALRSRNAMLRADSKPDINVLAAFDEQLIEHGTVIHESRVEGISALAPVARHQFAHIMANVEPLTLRLASGVAEVPEASFADSFRQQLGRSYARDRARGMTSVGPHRADLILGLGDRDARSFASQGQQRAMVLALKLAEVTCLHQRLGTTPILLLDDVSSELDAERTRMLFDTLSTTGAQLWVSTTGSTTLPVASDTQVLEVSGGRISH